MGKILGIDLGTTNSVAAIAEVLTGKGFHILPRCPGVSVVCDRLGRRFTPSVIAEDDSGNFVVGDSAKARAGLTPPPIMFAKRWMGENHAFQLNKKGVLQPEDASAEILKYLKAMAEKQLGEPVTEAVITVPAYFDLLAKQKTAEAGEKAGLVVKQLALEPVAAALMYCANETRKDLRILTYDLGGGTFDVAIIERKDGIIAGDAIVSFDGNRFLGGYNFDMKLADWMLDQLCATGYDLKLEPDNLADTVIHAKMMIIAEQVKIKLSHNDVCVVHEPAPGIIDHKGEPVVIEMEITRDQFEGMIKDDIEETILITKRAMTKNPDPKKQFKPDQIDEIIMVGGSSRIPMVLRRLQEEFGREPKLVEPDLCVGIGAAIIAGVPPQVFGHLRLADLPSATDRTSFNLAGKVESGEDLPDVGGCRIVLNKADGSLEKTKVSGADGGFAFVQLPLTPNSVNQFKLSGTSKTGKDIGTGSFSIRQGASTAPAGGLSPQKQKNISVPDVLVKAIGVMMRDGPHEIAPAGTKLPCEINVKAVRGDASNLIRIQILEENKDLGSILMEDVPKELPIGSEVQITLTIGASTQAFKGKATAFVPALGRNQEVEIEIPKATPKSPEELRRDFEQLLERAADAKGSVSPADRFAKADAIGELDRLLKALKGMLAERELDCTRIQHSINEANTLIRGLAGWKPSPPRVDFDRKADEVANLIKELNKKKPETEKDGYDQQLADIRKEADAAYKTQNQAVWELCYNKIVKLCDSIDSIGKAGEKGAELPPPGLVLIHMEQQLNGLKEDSRKAGTYERRKSEFDDAAKSLEKIKADDPDFWNKFRDWYKTKFMPLQESGAKGSGGGKGGELDWVGFGR